MELWRCGAVVVLLTSGCAPFSITGKWKPIRHMTPVISSGDKTIINVSHDMTELYWNAVETGHRYEVTIRPDSHRGYFAWIQPFGAKPGAFRANVKATPSLLVQQTSEGKPGGRARPAGNLSCNCLNPLFDQVIDTNGSRHFAFTIQRRKDTKLGEFDVDVQELPSTPGGHRTFLLSETGRILGFMPAG